MNFRQESLGELFCVSEVRGSGNEETVIELQFIFHNGDDSADFAFDLTHNICVTVSVRDSSRDKDRDLRGSAELQACSRRRTLRLRCNNIA